MTVSVVVQTTLVSVSITQFYSDQAIQSQLKLFSYEMTIFVVGSISVSISQFYSGQAIQILYYV